MKKIWKRVCTGLLALTTILTALPTTSAYAAETQYWTESSERVGYIEHVMNDGTIHSTFNEGHMKVEGETAYCVDINTGFKNGYKTRHDANTSMSATQIEDVALSLEYVKQYRGSHSNLNANQGYLLEQCVVWQRLSEYLGWQCDNVRAAYSEISQDIQNEVYAGARAFVQANKGRYKCGGYIYTGEGQDLGQFWAELNVGNAKVKKTTANEIVTNGNAMYTIAGATFGIFSDQNCSNQIGTLTTNENGETNEVEVTAGNVYIKELSAPKGYKLDTTVHSLKVEAGKTAVLNVSDVPKVTETLVDLFKIDMETGKATAQGNAALTGAEFTWHYYDGLYTKDNLPEKATRTWATKTVAEKDSNGNIHYVTKLADAYKVSGDTFYTQNEKSVLPLGTLTVEETKAPDGYLLDGAYMQAGDSTEQIKGMYLTQITEDGELAVLSGSNQYSVSDQVIRGGVKIQKRDMETKDTKAQGSATLKDAAFAIISLNENPVLVEGKLYKKNETVKTIQTGIDGVATTSADLLPYGKYKLEETKAPEGYLTDGAKAIEFSITENRKIVDLTGESHSIYNQIKRGDLEGVKIGAGTHKRLANVPFKITSKTTGESHIVVTDKNGQFSTASDWASHKKNTNAGTSSEDGIWFGISEPDDSKGALLYDTYEIEELSCESNKGMKLISAFEVVVSRNKVTIDLGTLTDEYEKEISIHTTATDKKTGEKVIVAGKKVTIVDTVTLDGLEEGRKYQLKGWQMLKEENAELLIDGKRVESDYTFVADSEKMKVEISYTFDASELGGQNLVTFEELYDLKNPEEPVKVAEHKDTDDEGQTVLISVPVISIIVCIRILLPDRRGVRSTIVLFLLFINVFIFYLHDEVQKSYIETAKQEEMKIQMSQYAKELEMMMKSQDRLNKIHHDYKHHLTTIGAMAKTGGNEEILSYLKQMENIAGTALCHHLYTENRNMNNLLNYILEDSKSVIENPEISVEIPNHIGEELFDISIIVGNLMDNAIRGTAASDERRLSFQMYYGKGIMNIQIENSIKDTPKVRNGIYLTTKSRKEGHGIGLQNVKLVVEKYHGQMEICHTEKSFQVKILLYMKLDEK